MNSPRLEVIRVDFAKVLSNPTEHTETYKQNTVYVFCVCMYVPIKF